MLRGMNIETGVDLDKLLLASKMIADFFNRKPNSKVAQALLSQ